MFSIVCALHLRSESAKALRECKQVFQGVHENGLPLTQHKNPSTSRVNPPSQARFHFKHSAPARNSTMKNNNKIIIIKKSYLPHVTNREKISPNKSTESRSQLSLVTAWGGGVVLLVFFKKKLTKNKYHKLA